MGSRVEKPPKYKINLSFPFMTIKCIFKKLKNIDFFELIFERVIIRGASN